MVEKINQLIQSRLRKMLPLLLGLWTVMATTIPCQAGNMPTFISDDETETLIHNITRPLFNAAGVSFDPNKIFIIHDNSLNAFVSNGNYLFIHTGTLLNANSVNEISGIIAHETGHIAGGHIVRQKLQVNKAQTLAVASLIAAGAAAAASGRGDAAMAIMLGSHSTLLNSLTAYKLQEERSADESAVKYLAKTGQSPLGLKNFMKKIQNHNRLSGFEEVPYFRTHPLSHERLEFFNAALVHSSGKDNSIFDPDFQMVNAKLAAFLLPLNRVRQLYPQSNKTSAAQYAQAIIYYRENNLGKAIENLKKLSASQPENPYFYELQGQFLLESGQLQSALNAYDKALKLHPNSTEIMMGWAQTALEIPHNKNQLQKIINRLNQIIIKRPSLNAWLLLARAYQEDERPADALYASAQYSLGIGNLEIALRQIKQAQQNNPSAKLKLKLTDLENELNAIK